MIIMMGNLVDMGMTLKCSECLMSRQVAYNPHISMILQGSSTTSKAALLEKEILRFCLSSTFATTSLSASQCRI